MPIEWSDDFLIGNALLDGDHHHIIMLINSLETIISMGADRRILSTKYAEIVDCLCEHFLREEHIMKAAKYPDVDAHTEMHGRLFDILSKMTLLIESNDQDAVSNIINFLHKWFFGHVMVSDKSFGEYLHEKS